MSSTSCVEQHMVQEFEHSAVFYRGSRGLVDSVVPFVRDGVRRGEAVLVALLPERLAAVEAALGPDATRVDFVDMAELGANPACIIPEWRRFVENSGDGGMRGVGEPIWSGRREVETVEAVLHEALLNDAFHGEPAWQLMCPYDVESLPPAVIEQAVRCHPIAEGSGLATAYAGASLASTLFASDLPPAPSDADVFFFGPDDLKGLRRVVERLAALAGIRQAAAEDLVLAAHELATNSVVHGGGAGVLSAWSDPDAFIVEVRDAGVIDDPLVGRDLLQGLAENGRGIWMANQLCDLVQVRSGASGTVVRLFDWL